ncbi:hypothetical protein [Streptomyces scabiei]|uniref:hypothetical protein n=1 Tax=Streptomyces scabiei TaxID=1930 RepID=UPI0029B737F1|nr:hypothetical protein [Streptomyces scabiei]MDX3522357.1 hypothetical protein [Streptomyces scabiei]
MTFPIASEYQSHLGTSRARHPNERARLVVAVGFVWIVFGIFAVGAISAGGSDLLYIFLAILFVVAVEWLFHRLRKAHLLGRAVKVTPDSFPEIYAEISELQRKLDYHRPVDVYVLDEVDGQMTVTSLLGTRVLLIQGGFAADLQEDGPAALRFMLGNFICWLKARHGRLTLSVIILDHLKILAYVAPWMLPYWRCSAYTCDQYGYLCAEDLHASLGVIARLAVGKELGPNVSPTGILEQAYQVSRRPLSRYAELVQSEPHLVNRYVNLVAFAGSLMPADYARFRAGLDEKGRRLLRDLMVQTPHRQSSGPIPASASGPR